MPNFRARKKDGMCTAALCNKSVNLESSKCSPFLPFLYSFRSLPGDSLQPLPKRVLQRVGLSASSLNFLHTLFSEKIFLFLEKKTTQEK
jgi:hypothetical protein